MKLFSRQMKQLKHMTHIWTGIPKQITGSITIITEWTIKNLKRFIQQWCPSNLDMLS